jgi:hypothetical protein
MTEERIIRTENPDGTTSTTHTTVINDGERDGGAGKWFLLLILAIAIAAVIYFISMGSNAEIAKDTAITDAANQVGEAAGQVGEAAQDAAGALDNN